MRLCHLMKDGVRDNSPKNSANSIAFFKIYLMIPDVWNTTCIKKFNSLFIMLSVEGQCSVTDPWTFVFTVESAAIESNECGVCRQAGKLGLWDPIKPGYKEYA